jgi:hypothetical protein
VEGKLLDEIEVFIGINIKSSDGDSDDENPVIRIAKYGKNFQRKNYNGEIDENDAR